MPRKKVKSCAVPPGLVPVQKFSVHVMNLLGNVYKCATFFEKCRYIPLFQWFDKWNGPFYSLDVETLLTLDTLPHRIRMKRSTIPHPNPEQDLFSFCTMMKERWPATTMALESTQT